MKIKGCTAEDFVNYKKPSMYIAFPTCNFKCDKEAGNQICQNSSLAKIEAVDIDNSVLVNNYLKNDISKAIVFCGLEPFDSWKDLYNLVVDFRKKTIDDIVIYTGFTEDELTDEIQALSKFPNIVVKFGRFRPNQKSHLDPILGVKLASDNQYAKKIS